MPNSIPSTMIENNNSDFIIRVKKFRIKIFFILMIILMPAIIMKVIKMHTEILNDKSIIVTFALVYTLISIVMFYKFLNMKCPRCGEGYFTKYEYIPKLMYKLKCQNCGLNIFTKISACDAVARKNVIK